MSSLAKNTKATVIPVLRYRDAPAVETQFGRLMKQPDEIGGAETQSSYAEGRLWSFGTYDPSTAG